MARRIGIGLAAGLVAAVVVVVVLLATVLHRDLQQGIGTRLVKAAVGQRGLTVLSLIYTLRSANAEHPTFACAGDDSALELAQVPEDIVSGLQLPRGNWLVSERGRADGTSYVIIYNSEAGPIKQQSFGPNWRKVELAHGELLCLVPEMQMS